MQKGPKIARSPLPWIRHPHVPLLGLLCALSAPAAQTNVPSPGQLAPKTHPPESQPQGPTVLLREPEQPAPAAGDQMKVTVSRFVLEDSDPKLLAIAARTLSPLSGHPVPLLEIYAAVAGVEQNYVDGGHFFTRIIVPPQHLRDGGELRLAVIHGFIEWVDVDDIPETLHTRVSAVLAPLLNNPSITRGAFERALLVLNDIPNLKLKASLRPGPADGSVILVLRGEYRAFTRELAIDNSLPALLGQTSATLSVEYNSGSEPIDQLYLTASGPLTSNPFGSSSPRSLILGGLRSAVGISGAAIDANLTWSATKPKSSQGTIDTESTYQRGSLHGAFPLVKSRASTLIAEATLDATSETQHAPQFGTTLYDDELRVMRLGLAADHVFSTRLQASAGLKLSRGVHALGSRALSEATVSDPLSQAGASDVFTKWEWRGALHSEVPVVRAALDLQLRGQRAGRPLLLSEKFTMGGPIDLSAYDAASFSGDQGWVARGELQRNLEGHLGAVNALAQAYLFAAHGEVEMRQPTAVERRTSVGSAVGVGARASSLRRGFFRPVSLSAELARQTNPFSAAMPDHWRVSVSLTADF